MAENIARTVRLLYEVVEQGAVIHIHFIHSLGVSLLLQSRADERVDELVRYPHLSLNFILPELNQAPGFRIKPTRLSIILSSVEGRGEPVRGVVTRGRVTSVRGRVG